MGVRAVQPFRTKPKEIVLAYNLTDVLVAAFWSMFAKSSRVPYALFDLTLWIYMQVNALWIAAFAVLAVEPTLGHTLQVVLVQEFTVVAFFAQTPEPVLADHGLFGFNMA